MDPEPTSPSVFISYASADRERAFEICRYLEDMGHRCWIAPRDIRAGHDYGEEIIRGIERSRCFVLVFSSAANASIYVKRELERAVSKAKPVFPVRLEDVLPSASLELHLASLHFLDAWNGVLRDHVSSLARALSGEGDEIPHRAPSAQPAPPAPWWRHPKAIGAAGAAVVVLGALAWWRIAGQPEEPAWQDSAGAGVPGAGTPAVATAPARRGAVQGAALSGCRQSAGAPIVRCSGAPPGSRVLVSTAQGDEIAIPAGSGADSVSAGGVHRRSTYLPWPGPGGSARVETPEGLVSQEEPLPGAPGLAAAVPVPALDSHAPPLFYAWAGSGWAWLFFAPMDTMEVDWSIDGAAPVRMTRSGVYSGPIALDSDADGTKSLTLRWRNQAGEWSEPHDYRTDVPAARIASVKSLQDLVGSITCYRVAEAPIPAHLRCTSTSAVPLGYLFEELRWGTGAGDLQPVDAFDFRDWARGLLPRLEHSTASNQQLRELRALEVRIESEAGTFVPWRDAERIMGSGVFLAMSPIDGDPYFEAVPKGGGSRLSTRIHVADRKP